MAAPGDTRTGGKILLDDQEEHLQYASLLLYSTQEWQSSNDACLRSKQLVAHMRASVNGSGKHSLRTYTQ